MVASGVAFRVASMVSIFAAGLVGAALPFFVSSRYPRVLGLLNAAAAGVFLAAALVHLLVRPQLHRRGAAPATAVMCAPVRCTGRRRSERRAAALVRDG